MEKNLNFNIDTNLEISPAVLENESIFTDTNLNSGFIDTQLEDSEIKSVTNAEINDIASDIITASDSELSNNNDKIYTKGSFYDQSINLIIDSNFCQNVLELQKFVEYQYGIAKDTLSLIIKEYETNYKFSESFLSMVNKPNNQLQENIKSWLLNFSKSEIANLSNFVGSYTHLVLLRKKLSDSNFLDNLVEVSDQLKKNKIVYNSEIFKNLELLHHSSKACDIDHLFVKIFRNIINPQIGNADNNVCVMCYKQANISRTLLNAITRVIPFSENTNLYQHCCTILKNSLSHDGFLARLELFYGKEKAKKLLFSFISTGFSTYKFEIDLWLELYGIPPEKSLLVFEYIVHVKRLSSIFNTLFLNLNFLDSNTNLKTRINIQEMGQRITNLSYQRNTLNKWIKSLTTLSQYEIYEKYITSQTNELTIILQRASMHPQYQYFIKMCENEIQNEPQNEIQNEKNFFTYYRKLLNNEEELFSECRDINFDSLTSYKVKQN